MKIGVIKDGHPDETRAAIIPADVKKLSELGAQVSVEPGLGKAVFPDAVYSESGATLADRKAILSGSDMIVSIRPLEESDFPSINPKSVVVSLMDPFRNKAYVDALTQTGVSGVCLEMIPRTTLAQKMDVLSSQANLAGYYSVILGARCLQKIFPMMMTPAGTLSPAKVFVIGAGVAGLQAIATAKRLGARVEAFDTRPVVEEQVQSLGAKFVKVDLGETGQTEQGYAKQLTQAQLDKQKDVMAKHCAQADVVITTAQVFGKPAPRIVTKDMLSRMKLGSVVIDLAVETGGNVEGSEVNKEVDVDGVCVVGLANIPGQIADAASQMVSANITNLISHFWNKETKSFDLNLEDEILDSAVIVHQGKLRSEIVAAAYKGA